MQYVVRTKQVVEREYVYDFELELPIEARTADRIVVGAAKSGKLQLGIDIPFNEELPGEEKVTSVTREGTQVYPRVRKQAGKLKAPVTLNTLEDE